MEFDCVKVRTFILILMSFVYLWAFASLYTQIPGLYGDNGILPARSVLKCDQIDPVDCVFFGSKPTLLHLTTAYGATPMQGLELLCLLGIILSSLSIIFPIFRDFFVYSTLWYSYFSCFQVGQTFLWFQWDTLLIETGFLIALVAPCQIFRKIFIGKKKKASSFLLNWMPHDNVTLFLVRWLAFRFMFSSGIVKLTAECPTWWSLTALHYHFESQCIPTVPAWYAHQLPDWLKKLSVVGTFTLEIFVPLLFLMPFKLLRVFAFLTQTFLMILIMITGNYNFFNVLTIAVCAAMLVESPKSKFSSQQIFERKFPKSIMLFKCVVATLTIYFVVIWPTVKYFSLRLDGWSIESNIAFTKEQFYAVLTPSMKYLIIFGCFCFGLEIFTALIRCIVDFWAHSTFTKLRVLSSFVVMSSISLLIFVVSLVPFSYLDRRTNENLWPVVKELHDQSDNYQLVHAYGLFRSMTGVGGRPEVIVLGSMDTKGPWKEYEFLYKPGSLNRRPPFLIPHQARLDWQMWFAALGSYQYNEWFISFVWKLLKNEPQVLKLIDTNPFRSEPPKFIRADLYHYHYTTLNSSSKNWWTRDKQGEYMPAVSLQNEEFEQYLIQRGLYIQKPKKPKLATLTNVLRWIRRTTENFDHPQFIWALTVSVVFVGLLKKLYVLGGRTAEIFIRD